MPGIIVHAVPATTRNNVLFPHPMDQRRQGLPLRDRQIDAIQRRSTPFDVSTGGSSLVAFACET
ncbi:MAG: hypothetical protein MZV70_17970 [Desulfobacterales bacterium]|nr:hypothetical protein [Desulfobacterales bacterium]